MTNTNYKEVIATMKRGEPVAVNSSSYKTINSSIQGTMRDIARTQQMFELKKATEEQAVGERAYGFLAKWRSRTNGKRYADWSDLFKNQLTNVDALNGNLAQLVRLSAMHSEKLKVQLLNGLGDARSHYLQADKYEGVVPGLHDECSKDKEKLEGLTPDSIEYFDALEKSFKSTDALKEAVNEVALIKSVKSNDLQKIEFLRKHYEVHKGLIFSAKGFAVGTRQLCDSLDHLLGVYETIRPMSQCLQGIHKGVITLGDYTDSLNKAYEKTYDIISVIENFDGPTIFENTSQLEAMSNGMLDSLEKKVTS